MKGILLIYVLSITSSYNDDVEHISSTRFDVLEWWIAEDKTFRIKTFSMDNDIHIYQIDSSYGKELAIKNSIDNYGDVIANSYEIQLNGTEKIEDLQQKLKDLGLKGNFEISDFVFWNPDGFTYKTKSKN